MARKTLAPIFPSAPIRIKYQKRVDATVDEMARSLSYWLLATYRADTPATVAMDSAASILQAAYDKLATRWLDRFDVLADAMGHWFGPAVLDRVDTVMKADLRKAGFTVKFQMTKAMKDAFDAVSGENVGLIKSIGSRHLESVRVILNQSVANGRDAGYMAEQLEKQLGVTKRRAALIARSQSNMATAVFTRVRAIENGMTEAIWMHSAASKDPRPEHLAFNGHRFDLRTGHDFEDGNGPTFPGVQINCRCVWRAYLPDFE